MFDFSDDCIVNAEDAFVRGLKYDMFSNQWHIPDDADVPKRGRVWIRNFDVDPGVTSHWSLNLIRQ